MQHSGNAITAAHSAYTQTKTHLVCIVRMICFQTRQKEDYTQKTT